jgi:peptidoglycan-associated lipoprotein
MTWQTKNNWTPSLLTMMALLTSGCTAQELAPKSTQHLLPETAEIKTVDPSKGLFVKNENLKPIYFESGQSQLDPKLKEMVKPNVDWLKENLPLQIQVAGYSDGRGTPEQNLATGQRRAAALRDFYVSMGIPRSRISTVSYGQEEPVCFDQTDECQAQNRRADTLIENKSSLTARLAS